MSETPRSSKRRRLNSSPNDLPSAERPTRRSAKSNPVVNNVYDVISITESPVYEVNNLRESATKKTTPRRHYTKKDATPQKRNLSTPARNQAKPHSSPQKAQKSTDKSTRKPTSRQYVTDARTDEEDELALPNVIDEVADELDADPANAGLLKAHPVKTSRGRKPGNTVTHLQAGNGIPTKAKRKSNPSNKPIRKADQSGDYEEEEEEEAMDIDQVEEEPIPSINGVHATTNGIGYTMLSASPKINPDQLSILKDVVISKLSQRRPTPLKNLDTEHTKVHHLLHATITAGESNSLLLIGARGSGKSAMIDSTLRDLSRSQKEHFHTIRLNGFIQTDDKLALREIWRQLGREMEISDTEDAGGKSYADTLAMLLALLSHPDEIAGTATNGSSVAKSVIFIIDEFDLFATHARQTLLYNLLDIAQSRKAPIAIIGLTTRIDVTEALEKRVKSRFSHRYVHLSLPKTMSEFVDIGKAALSIDLSELTVEEKMKLLGGVAEIEPVSSRQPATKESDETILTSWNTAIEALFVSSSFLKTHIYPIYYTTKSIPTLFSSFLVSIATLHTLPEPSFFTSSSCLHTPPDSNLHLLPSLSELALSLLIAAARLAIIHSTDTTNFALAYSEYVSLASKARINSAASGALASGAGTRVFGKEVGRREWEKLVGRGLMVPVASGAFGLGGAGGATGSAGKGMEMVRVDVALEEIPLSVEMTAVMEKWCLQI